MNPGNLEFFFYKLLKGECLIWVVFLWGFRELMWWDFFHKCHELSGESISRSFPISWSWVWTRELSLRSFMLEWLSSKCHTKKKMRREQNSSRKHRVFLPFTFSFYFRGVTLGIWVLRNFTQDCILFLNPQHWRAPCGPGVNGSKPQLLTTGVLSVTESTDCTNPRDSMLWSLSTDFWFECVHIIS